MNEGTPQGIDEAIVRIVCFRPPEGTTIDVYARNVMRDFMSQKFSSALLKAHTNEQRAMLADLWQSLTGEPVDWGNE